MKTLCCGPGFRRVSKSIHRWQSSGHNPVCTASPRNQRYSCSATLEKKQSLYLPVVTETATHMRSRDNAWESFFHPSIVEKGRSTSDLKVTNYVRIWVESQTGSLGNSDHSVLRQNCIAV